MADRPYLLRFERAADLEHDRGGRLDLVAREQRPLGHHQMHAGGDHPVDAADGAGEFAFERAQIIDVLHEARRAQRIRFVENLVADAAALGQAFSASDIRNRATRSRRHHDDIAVVAQFVGDTLPLEILNDRGGILVAQVGKQRRHLRRGHAQDEEGEKADQRDGDGAHRGDARRAERFDELKQTLHRSLIPRLMRRVASHSARIARFMVSVGLMRVARSAQNAFAARRLRNRGRRGDRRSPAESENAGTGLPALRIGRRD